MARDPEHNRALLQHVTDLSAPVTLKLQPACKLTGQVTDPQGSPVCAARINLDSRVSNGLAYVDERVLTDRQGRFTLRAIPPMQSGFNCRLTINAVGYGPAKYKQFEAPRQTGETQDIGAFTLIPATESVAGCVVTANGVPVPEAEVRVQSARGDVPQYSNFSATDEQGRFRLPLLCKGAIKIEVSGGSKYRGTGTLRLRAQAENVKIVLGKDLDHDDTLSLLGEPLPNLSALSKDIDVHEIDGKPLLLCLMDIQQRPSRRCLYELSQKRDDLTSKGVTLVVVQISKVDLARYEAFLKAGQIDMPILMMDHDFEPKKTEWRVKGLPWLILIDQSHVVTAEGLSVNELVVKLKELGYARP
jgi:hypothetical protein